MEVGGKKVLGRGGSTFRGPAPGACSCISGTGGRQQGWAWRGREAGRARNRAWRAVQDTVGVHFGSDGDDHSTCSMGSPDCWLRSDKGTRVHTGVREEASARLQER